MHPEEFWRLAPNELAAIFVGVGKQREWWYELGLFVAWHVAAFHSQAKAGKLQPWSQIRAKLIGASEETPADDWRTRKDARQQQMAQFKKHQAQRLKPPKRSHG